MFEPCTRTKVVSRSWDVVGPPKGSHWLLFRPRFVPGGIFIVFLPICTVFVGSGLSWSGVLSVLAGSLVLALLLPVWFWAFSGPPWHVYGRPCPP